MGRVRQQGQIRASGGQAGKTKLVRANGREREIGAHPLGEKQVMIKIFKIGLGDENGVPLRHSEASKYLRGRKLNLRRIDEVIVAGAGIDDEAVVLLILADGENAVDNRRRRGEVDHTAVDHARQKKKVFGVGAEDGRSNTRV